MKNEVIISKMVKYVDKVLHYTDGMSYDQFYKNEMVQEACVFNISQLGEFANKIDDEFEKSHTSIPWRQIYGLRNRIVHDYEGVNLQLVWQIIDEDLPDLRNTLAVLLEE